MILSKSCVYAIRASILVAALTANGKRSYIPVRELSEELNISFHFLTKVLQILTQSNILKSFKGPRGGIGLAKPSTKISLLDIIKTVDGLRFFENCHLGLPECNDDSPCPLHNKWKVQRHRILNMYEKTYLSKFVNNIEHFKLRG